MRYGWTVLACVGLLAAAEVRPSWGQGKAADYQRAADMDKFTNGKVTHATVDWNWNDANTQFWFVSDLGNREREYVLVDAVHGTRAPAFDHVKLAAALAKTVDHTVNPSQLPIETLRWSAGSATDGKQTSETLQIRAYNKTWAWNAQTATLTEIGATTTPAVDTKASTTPASTEPNAPQMPDAPQALDTPAWDHPPPLPPEPDDLLFPADAPADTQPATQADAQRTGDPTTTTAPATQPTRTGRRGGNPANQPANGWRAEVNNGNLSLRSSQTSAVVALTTNATPDDGYKSNDIFWSPDGTKFVAWRTKAGVEHKVYLVQSSPPGQVQPKLLNYDYYKPGDQIPVRKPHLFDALTQKEIPVSDALFPTPWCEDPQPTGGLRWAPDSSRFTFFYNQRGHEVLRVIAVDVATGEAKAIIDETTKTFIDYSNKTLLRYLDETNEIIWMSERDGWNHLYLYDAATGQVKNQITKGEWVVRSWDARQLDRVDTVKRQIWFRAGGMVPGQDPYYIHFCRVDFDGKNLVDLTPGDGTHTVKFSPDKKYLLDTYSRVDMAPVTELRRAEDGGLICTVERGDMTALTAAGWTVPERFVAKARDGTTDIYGVIYRPMKFDAERKYPVVEDIYAGPHGSFVPKDFHRSYSQQSMAELGFILVQIDGMGTNNRSRAFHDVCWRNVGDAGFPDRILWMKAAATKYPYMDISRVGVFGTSAGGQSALRALEAFGDFYKVASADCGCHDNRMDKIWWNEAWMGWPIGPWYAEQSNVTNANRVNGPLLLFVGETDHNVDPATTMQVVNALIKANKDFDLLVVPNSDHGATRNPYAARKRNDFFVRNLLHVEPRGT